MLLFHGGTSSWASVLTVNGASSNPIKFSFKANCMVNGRIRQGQTCRVRWNVPNGWEFRVDRQITSDDSICLNNSNFGITYNRTPGTTLSAGMGLNYTATMKREILWLNSGLCQVGYEVTARIVNEAAARNSVMNITPIVSADFTAGITSSEAISNNWGPYVYKTSYNMAPAVAAVGGVPSIGLDITDNIDLNPANKVNNIDGKILFRIINIASRASSTINIAKSGEAASLIEVYRNGAATPGCQGTYQRLNEFCEVRTLPNINWFGGDKK